MSPRSVSVKTASKVFSSFQIDEFHSWYFRYSIDKAMQKRLDLKLLNFIVWISQINCLHFRLWILLVWARFAILWKLWSNFEFICCKINLSKSKKKSLFTKLWICLVWPGLLWWGRCGQINKHPWLPWDWVIACVLFSDYSHFHLSMFSFLNLFHAPKNNKFGTRILCSVAYDIPTELSQYLQCSQLDSADSGLGLLLLNLRGNCTKSPNPWKTRHV